MRALLLCLAFTLTCLPVWADGPKVTAVAIVPVPDEQKESGDAIGNVEVTYADGSKKLVTDSGRCLHPQFSKGGLVAWTVFETRNDRGIPVNGTARVLFNDGTTKDFTHHPPFFEEVAFDGEERLALRTRFSHGPAYYALFDLKSGKLLEQIDQYVDYKNAPKWAQAVHDEREDEP